MPGVPSTPATPIQEPPRLETNEKKPLPCEAYEEGIRKDIQEINKDLEGGFVHRVDLWVLAIALRIISHEEAYSRSCEAKIIFIESERETIRQKLFEHLQKAEDRTKGKVTRTAYATRARANAAVLVMYAPGMFAPQIHQCREWKEKSEEYNVQSFLTEDRNTILLFSTLSTTYGFLHKKFCLMQ